MAGTPATRRGWGCVNKYVCFLLCKLMRIDVFLFSQHGIRTIIEFENTRVMVTKPLDPGTKSPLELVHTDV